MSKKKLKRIIIVFLLSLFVMLGISMLYFKYGGYLWMQDTDKDEWISEIKSSSALPDRFYELYDLIYPSSLDNSQLSYLISRDLFNNRSECPCRLAAYYSDEQTRLRVSLPQLTFYLENFASQKECLNYYVRKIDFRNGVIGLENASINFFNKDLNDLADDEFIELTLVMQNPSYFNRKRHPELIDKQIEGIKQKINTLCRSTVTPSSATKP